MICCHPHKVTPFDEIEHRRKMAVAAIEETQRKMLEEMDALSPETLEALNNILNEYKDVLGLIDSKLLLMDEKLKDSTTLHGYAITEEYNRETMHLILSIGKEG